MTNTPSDGLCLAAHRHLHRATREAGPGSLAFDLLRARALSSEVDSGSREENAAEQEDRASLGFWFCRKRKGSNFISKS
jgi:hypothetical protein